MNVEKLPPLFSLRAFEAAARLDSFSKASIELNLTPAAIAHQVKKLESGLGVDLFQRHPRGVKLNESGRAYLAIVQSVLAELQRNTQIFKAHYQAQPIRIGALHIVSERIVRPMVQEFLGSHPDIRSELIADLREPNFKSDNLDVVIWHGENPPDDYENIKILSENLTPVCSPELLNKYPNGITLNDLKGIPALYDLYWEHDWELWLSYIGGPELNNSMGFSLYSALIQTALDGGGIAIGHTGLLGKEIGSGKLVKPFKDEVRSPKQYFALTDERNLSKPNVRLFWNWLKSHSDSALL